MEPALKIVNSEVQEVTTLALSVPDQAKAIAVIKTSDDYVRAGEILITIKDIRKKIEATFKPIKQKMDAAKKEVLDQEKAADAPLKQAEDWLKPLLRAYDDEQERIRKEEKRRLQEEARKREEEERLAAAIQAEQEGAPEEAAAILEEEVYVAPVIVPKSTPQVQRISYREDWDFEITDPNAIPREYLMIDEVKIRKIVRAMKGSTRINGIKVFTRKIVAAGRR